MHLLLKSWQECQQSNDIQLIFYSFEQNERKPVKFDETAKDKCTIIVCLLHHDKAVI